MVSSSKRQSNQDQVDERRGGGFGEGSFKNVFCDKKIYLDLKSCAISSCLTRSLTSLGAVVEEFFCKDVDLIITDDAESQRKIEKSTTAIPSSICKNDNCHDSLDSLPLAGRGDTFINNNRNLKARSTGTCDLFANASKWGILVWSLNKILKHLQRLGVPVVKPSHQNSQDHAIYNRKLKNPYVKIENLKGSYRPVYKEFAKWPELNLISSNFSPFAELKPISVMGNSSPRKSGNKRRLSTANLVPERNPQKRMKMVKHAKKSGYCEICCLTYQDLKKHLASSYHRQSAQNDEKYCVLDSAINNGLGLSDLVKSLDNSNLICSTRRSARNMKVSSGSLGNKCGSGSKSEDQINMRVTRSSHRQLKSESELYGQVNKASEFNPLNLYQKLPGAHAEISVCEDSKLDDKIFNCNIRVQPVLKFESGNGKISVMERVKGCSTEQYLNHLCSSKMKNEELLRDGSNDYFNVKILCSKLRSTNKHLSDRKTTKECPSERFLDKENIDKNVAYFSPSVDKGYKRKRVSSDIALLIDNKEYYHLETLPERLRHNSSKSEGTYVADCDVPSLQECNELKPTIPVKLETLSPDVTVSVDSPFLASHNKDKIYSKCIKLETVKSENLKCTQGNVDHNFNISNPLFETKDYLLSHVKNTFTKRVPSGSIIASNLIRRRYQSMRKRTQAEIFLSENKDYYKFDFPKSRLRAANYIRGEDEYLVYKFGLDYPLKATSSSEDSNPARTESDSSVVVPNNNVDDTKEPIHKKRGRKPKCDKLARLNNIEVNSVGKLNGDLVNSGPPNDSDMLFSFELEPVSEPWYETFQRSSETGFQVNSCPEFFRPFLLPYEMPFDVILKRRSSDVPSNKSKCYIKQSLPRKSPRCHASTLAMLSQWFPRRKKTESLTNSGAVPNCNGQEDYNALHSQLNSILNSNSEDRIDDTSLAAEDVKKVTNRRRTRSHSVSETQINDSGALNGYSIEVKEHFQGVDVRELKHYSDVELDASFFTKDFGCTCMKEVDDELQEAKIDNLANIVDIGSLFGKFKGKKRKTNRTGWPNDKLRRKKHSLASSCALSEEYDSDSVNSDSSCVAENYDSVESVVDSPYKFLRKRTLKSEKSIYSDRFRSQTRH